MVRVGGYELLSRLGSGATGAVWLAEHRRTLERELRALARLDHRHVGDTPAPRPKRAVTTELERMMHALQTYRILFGAGRHRDGLGDPRDEWRCGVHDSLVRAAAEVDPPLAEAVRALADRVRGQLG